MKKEISSIELHFLIQELKLLIGERIDQIYSLGKKDFLFQFRLKDKKEILRITPDFIFITKSKEISETKNGFLSILRKTVKGKKISSIDQYGSERIVKIIIGDYILYSHFFAGKDKILCDKENTILASTSHNDLKKGNKYDVEEKNLFEVDYEQFKDVIDRIDKNISKTIAIKLGVGGIYAEEICERSEMDKNKEKISNDEKEELYKASKSVLEESINPIVIYINSIPEDAIPFELKKYASAKKENAESFNEALRTVIEYQENESKKKQSSVLYGKEKQRLTTIKQLQEANLQKIEKEAQEFQRKGELIYEKYPELKEIFDAFHEFRKQHSLNEIKQILKKKYPNIKDLNEKEKKLILEI